MLSPPIHSTKTFTLDVLSDCLHCIFINYCQHFHYYSFYFCILYCPLTAFTGFPPLQPLDGAYFSPIPLLFPFPCPLWPVTARLMAVESQPSPIGTSPARTARSPKWTLSELYPNPPFITNPARTEAFQKYDSNP